MSNNRNSLKAISNLKILLCDDEVSGTDVLSHLLKNAGAENIVCFNNSQLTLKYLTRNQVDVAFLDINMPGITGIDLALRVKGLSTKVVFVTAYEKYALSAHQVDAIDFLTKPVSPARLEETLLRIVARVKVKETPSIKEYRIMVKDSDLLTPVWNREIKTIQAAGKYAVISTYEKTFVWRQSLSEIERKLDNDIVRIHRSTFINVRWIKNIESEQRKWFVIGLDDKKYALSSSYKSKLMTLLS